MHRSEPPREQISVYENARKFVRCSTERCSSHLSTEQSPEVSVVIVSWNTCAVTRACVRSIVNKCIGRSMEVIVVDNASTDDTVRDLESEFPGITIVCNNHNKGFAAANNDGFRFARGRYVLLLNSDTVVHDDVVDKTVRFADSNPRIGVVGCRAIDVDGNQQSTMFSYLSLTRVFWNLIIPNRWLRRSRLFGKGRYVGLDLNQIHEVDVVSGCFMLVRREVLDTVGGLDGEFFMYGEEMEWCFRIKQAGWRVTYFPGAAYTHFGGISASRCQSEMNVEMARGQLLFLLKAHGAFKARIAACLMLLRDLPRALLWRVMAPVPGLRTSHFRQSIAIAVERLPFLIHVITSRKIESCLLRSQWKRVAQRVAV